MSELSGRVAAAQKETEFLRKELDGVKQELEKSRVDLEKEKKRVASLRKDKEEAVEKQAVIELEE